MGVHASWQTIMGVNLTWSERQVADELVGAIASAASLAAHRPAKDTAVIAATLDDLTEAKDEVRAEKQPATTVGLAEGYATHDQKLTLGRCEHGNAGGNYRNPTGDLYWCPQCRRDERDGIEVPIPAAIVALYDTAMPARAARGGYRAYTEPRHPDGTRDNSGQRAPL